MVEHQTQKTTVFYDGSCPLCRREIAFYRRQSGADALNWTDISAISTGRVADDLSCASAMKRFHVRRPDGTLVSGAAAFVAMWSQLPRFAWAARIGLLPGVRHFMEFTYRGFLLVRPTVQRLTKAAMR